MEGFTHNSVLLKETVNALPLETGKIFLDCTLGGGGHSEYLLKNTEGRLIAVDKDAFAIDYAKNRLRPFEGRVTFVKDDYRNIGHILDDLNIERIDGAMLDLGVSSFQLDDKQRGFSYNEDAPLDMRMDRDDPFSAYDVVNGYEKEDLARIIFRYGEEKFANRIAEQIVKDRPLNTTLELVESIKKAIPAAARRNGPHPARRTFQAIRIETNRELVFLKDTLETIIDRLNEGGRIAVISFHSLEDRIVKETFRNEEDPCICPPEFPVCVCGRKSKGKVITRKPIVPSEKELVMNQRARSAKLRVFERMTEK